jgi:hypothetical protein
MLSTAEQPAIKNGESVVTAVKLPEDHHRVVQGACVKDSVDLMGVCDIKPVLLEERHLRAQGRGSSGTGAADLALQSVGSPRSRPRKS